MQDIIRQTSYNQIMVFTKKIITTFGMLGICHLSYAELLWNPNPIQTEATTHNHQGQHDQHGQNNRNREKAFYLEDNLNATVRYLTPALESLSLTPIDNTNKYILPKTGMDNYHALIAERETDTVHESALRYPYLRGKPSGHSPEKLIKNHKLPLEIVPDPMIREHWRFYGNNTHSFQILYDQKPLVDSWVVLQTSNGTNLEATTNNEGKVSFTLPDDFKNIKPGRRANKPAEFTLRTAHIANNITYKANISAPYSVNPSHWQSNAGGIFALSIGFLSGIVIMRKHNRNNPPKGSKKKSSRRQA